MKELALFEHDIYFRADTFMLWEFCPTGAHNPREAPDRWSELNLTKIEWRKVIKMR